jgi:predicted Fe-S protein YdhL (DUF1289 family)
MTTASGKSPVFDTDVLLRLTRQAQQVLAADAAVSSPCQSICAMDKASGWCTGCLRHINEIAAWGGLGETPRRQIWMQIQRRAQHIIQTQEPS